MVDLKSLLYDLQGIVLVHFFRQLTSTPWEKKLRKSYVHGKRETVHFHVDTAKRNPQTWKMAGKQGHVLAVVVHFLRNRGAK